MADKKNPSKFANVAILVQSTGDSVLREAQTIADSFAQQGAKALHGNLAEESLRERVLAGEFDLVVALGGDGTVLRAGHLCAPKDIPLLGINLGRFGFLIEVEPERWPEMLPRLFNGEYWFERHMLLSVELWRDGKQLGAWEAVNEAMVGRGRVVRPVHLQARLDGHALTTYVADGLLIATPTGSTAYALAAGGPILPPDLRNVLLVPVAPHLSIDRAIVLAEGSDVHVEVERADEAVLSVDGQEPVSLQIGDRVEARASEHTLRFVRFQERGYFYRRLLSIMDNNPTLGKSSQ